MLYTVADLIDLDRFPIYSPGSARDAVIAQVRADMACDGYTVIRSFLTSATIGVLTKETDSLADKGHRSFNRINAYFTKDDPSLPARDPRRRFFDRSNTFIPADNFATTGPLRTIHNPPGFDMFIKDCLQEKALHRNADPLPDVIVNMAKEGNGFPWHFDTNNLTLTLAVQNAEAGVAFEYAAGIGQEDGNFDEVTSALDATSDRVTLLELQPGDLQLFRGRYSLHRVAPLSGLQRRYVSIFSYVEVPGMLGSPGRTRQLYGRILPIHLERARLRADAYLG